MYKNQYFRLIFKGALFIIFIFILAPTSSAIASDCPSESNCNFSISDGPYYVDENVTFTDTSNFPSNYIRNHHWDFNDGSPVECSINATHSFNQPGNYTITLYECRNPCTSYSNSKTIEVILRESGITEMAVSATSGSLTQTNSQITSASTPTNVINQYLNISNENNDSLSFSLGVNASGKL